MALNSTTISGAVTAGQTTIKLASGTGVAVNSFVRVDDEIMLIQDIADSPFLKVFRGYAGTTPAAHANGAIANIGLPSDFPTRPVPRQYTYTEPGAITVAPGTHILAGDGADAMTLANPTGADEGMELQIFAATAQAFTIAGAFNAGGGSADLETLGGAVGDGVRLRAYSGEWIVLSAVNATIS